MSGKTEVMMAVTIEEYPSFDRALVKAIEDYKAQKMEDPDTYAEDLWNVKFKLERVTVEEED